MFSQSTYRQIVLLPAWFAVALGLAEKTLPPDFLRALGRANWCGWTAYDIYDDFLDGQGNPGRLPFANGCFREAVTIYSNLFPGDKAFAALFKSVMDRVDAANVWEQENARIKIVDGVFNIPKTLPDFKMIKHLSDRSIGHALGPMAILFHLGYSANSFEIKQTGKFFEYYLAARQLSDDTHDWWEDLEKGFFNGASVKVLWAFGAAKINLIFDKDRLHKIFWLNSVPEILTAISGYLNKCRHILACLDIIKKPQRLLGMVSEIEKSVERTKLQQKRIKKII